MFDSAIRSTIESYFQEDDLSRNLFYTQNLPKEEVLCKLKLKSDLTLAGLPFFIEVFSFLGADKKSLEELLRYEGVSFLESDRKEIDFNLPFNIALTGERIALNLTQKASSIATYTKKFVSKAKESGIIILETRKTTPGHRALEKYAVRIGGGLNHRFGQSDMWMVKDNHKKFFGGVKEAVEFFKSMGSFYAPIEVEVHDLSELKEAIDLNVKHIMLDNFSPDDVIKAISLKNETCTYEVSGGINLGTIDNYLIKGVDAISIGSLTYGAPSVDLSMKIFKKGL